MRLNRLFRGFDKNGDALREEIELPENIELSLLQKIFGVESNNPMYDCFPITVVEAAAIEQHLGIHIPVAQYDFFLECDAED